MIKKLMIIFIFISILTNVNAQKYYKNLCYDNSDCSLNYLCKDNRCIPGCKEFYLNWEHKCKQKYDCQESIFKFCYSCKTREISKSFCEGLCFDNSDCKRGEFCNERKVCEKIDYQEKIINFFNKTKWFFIQLISLSVITFLLFNFIRSKRKEILKKGIIPYILSFALLLLLFYFVVPYIKKPDYSVYNHFILYPLYVSIPLFFIGIVVCFKSLNKQILKILKKIRFGVKINRYALYTIISLILLLLFWFMRTSHSLGDANSIVWDVEHGGKFVNMGEPLTHYVYHIAYQITKNVGFDGAKTITLVNCLAGSFFVFFLLLFADRTKNKAIVLGMILTLGTMQLFFGYIENYSILAAGIMAYIYVSFLYLKNKVDIIVPSFILTITFLAHLSAGFLFPSLLYLYYKRNKFSIFKWDFLKMSLAIIIPTTIVFLAAYGYFGGGVDEYVKEKPLGALQGGGDGHTIVALFERTTENEFYTMLSPMHFLEFLGKHILISPFGLFSASLLLFFYYKKTKKQPFINFLILMSIFYLVFTFIWNQDLGPYRDWDINSPSAIPYTLLAAILLNYTGKKERDYTALVMITISLLRILPWVIYNAFF